MFEKLADKKIVVIGDIIADLYRIMKEKKLSPEAPVIIFDPETEEYKAGGAGNVAVNLMALGIGNVCLGTVIGSETADTISKIKRELPENTFCVPENARITTIKERITTRRQQILRIDHQSDKVISTTSAGQLVEWARREILDANALIFSDYDHGVCIKEVVAPLLELAIAKDIPVIVDSKARDTLIKYRGATIALPNMDEARMMTKLDEFDDEDVVKFIFRNMKLKAAMITLGPRGIFLMDENEIRVYPPLHNDVKNEVVDVTGAGDTVAATVAAGIVLGLEYKAIVKLANISAGVKIQKRGVAAVAPSEIFEAIENNKIEDVEIQQWIKKQSNMQSVS